jgi:hypothetical protein
MPERATQDIDILVRAQDADQVCQRLEAAGYTWIASLGVPGFLMQSPSGIELDVLLGTATWTEAALRHLKRDPAGYPILDLPYLVLSKLTVSRVQDLADISRMLGLANEDDVARVRQVVARYTPDEVEDLESLIDLGQLENL